MPKFYVQCGPVRVVLSAESAPCAALAALDRMLNNHLWIYDDADLCDQDRHDHLMIESLLHLDPTVRLSECGFDREDALCIGTPEVVQHWHELMTGMNRLFASAGLLPRSMVAVAGVAETVADHPRLPR